MNLICDLIHRLNANLREDFEERAGIIEFDGALPREHAEALALLDVLRRHPGALLGIAALQAQLDGRLQYVLTTDLDGAREQLAAVDGRVIRAVDLSMVLHSRLGGLALLTRIE